MYYLVEYPTHNEDRNLPFSKKKIKFEDKDFWSLGQSVIAPFLLACARAEKKRDKMSFGHTRYKDTKHIAEKYGLKKKDIGFCNTPDGFLQECNDFIIDEIIWVLKRAVDEEWDLFVDKKGQRRSEKKVKKLLKRRKKACSYIGEYMIYWWD